MHFKDLFFAPDAPSTPSSAAASPPAAESSARQAKQVVVEVTFDHGPLGLRLRSIGSKRVVVHQFERSAEGNAGPVEASGLVQLGDQLTAVNAQVVDGRDFKGTVAMLKAAYWPITLRFTRFFDAAPLADPTAAPGVMLRTLEDLPGGRLALASAELRGKISDNNERIIRRAADLDKLILRSRTLVEHHSKGSAALAREISMLPYVQRGLGSVRDQIESVCDSIERVELLLDAAEAANREANPFHQVQRLRAMHAQPPPPPPVPVQADPSLDLLGAPPQPLENDGWKPPAELAKHHAAAMQSLDDVLRQAEGDMHEPNAQLLDLGGDEEGAEWEDPAPAPASAAAATKAQTTQDLLDLTII